MITVTYIPSVSPLVFVQTGTINSHGRLVPNREMVGFIANA